MIVFDVGKAVRWWLIKNLGLETHGHYKLQQTNNQEGQIPVHHDYGQI
jgi:hypothetical protein